MEKHVRGLMDWRFCNKPSRDPHPGADRERLGLNSARLPVWTNTVLKTASPALIPSPRAINDHGTNQTNAQAEPAAVGESVFREMASMAILNASTAVIARGEAISYFTE
jgi:hypothetical protein